MSIFKKFSISSAVAAVLVIAAVATFSFAAPAEAAKQPKSDVCHYQDVDKLVDPDGVPDSGDEFIDPLGWRIINISGNALNAHVGVHTDGAASDFVIDDNVAGSTTADCMALTPFIS